MLLMFWDVIVLKLQKKKCLNKWDPVRLSCIGDFFPADTAYTLGNGIGSNMSELITIIQYLKTNHFIIQT